MDNNMLKCNICDNSNLKDLVKFESNSGETFVVCSECIASADNTQNSAASDNMSIEKCWCCGNRIIVPTQGFTFDNDGTKHICETCVDRAKHLADELNTNDAIDLAGKDDITYDNDAILCEVCKKPINQKIGFNLRINKNNQEHIVCFVCADKAFSDSTDNEFLSIKICDICHDRFISPLNGITIDGSEELNVCHDCMYKGDFAMDDSHPEKVVVENTDEITDVEPKQKSIEEILNNDDPFQDLVDFFKSDLKKGNSSNGNIKADDSFKDNKKDSDGTITKKTITENVVVGTKITEKKNDDEASIKKEIIKNDISESYSLLSKRLEQAIISTSNVLDEYDKKLSEVKVKQNQSSSIYNGKVDELNRKINELKSLSDRIVELYKSKLNEDVLKVNETAAVHYEYSDLEKLVENCANLGFFGLFSATPAEKRKCLIAGKKEINFINKKIAYNDGLKTGAITDKSTNLVDEFNKLTELGDSVEDYMSKIEATLNDFKKKHLNEDIIEKCNKAYEYYIEHSGVKHLDAYDLGNQDYSSNAFLGFFGQLSNINERLFNYIKELINKDKEKVFFLSYKQVLYYETYREVPLNAISIAVPIEIPQKSTYSNSFNFEYSTYAENIIKSYILRLANQSKMGEYDYYFMDPISNGRSFAELNALVNETGYGLTNKIYTEKTEIGNALHSLSNKITEINKKIAGSNNLHEYNDTHEDKIKPTILVMFNFGDECYDPGLIKTIYSAADSCGITILSVDSQSSKTEKLYEAIEKFPYNRIAIRKENTVSNEGKFYIVQNGIDRKPYGPYYFFQYDALFYGPDMKTDTCYLQDNAVEWMENYVGNLEDGLRVKNNYSELEGLPDYFSLDSTYGLNIPFAVNKYNKIANFKIAAPLCYNAFISGQTGSGKSVLLHSIISGIIRCYHPDDVELWLVDYKAVEFSEYAKNPPPHVKLVGLDNSKEFTMSLIQKINSVMEARKKVIKDAGFEKIEEYKAKFGKNSMSRIVLIIDEAHRLSQHIADNENNSKEHFENFLAEYRSLGLTIILADQAFEASMNGITEKGKKQITVRAALRNAIDEIKATLGLESSKYQEDDLMNDIRTLSTGDVIHSYTEELPDKSALPHCHKVKGFWLTRQGDRENIIKKANEYAIQQGYKPKNPIFVNGVSRSTIFEAENPFENIRFIEEKARTFNVKLGTPSSLAPYHQFEMRRSRGANLISCGGNDSINLSLTYFTALNMNKQIGAKIFVLATERVLTDEFRNYFNNTFKNDVFIAETMNDYNKALDEINQTNRACLIIWYGIDYIIDDMQQFEPKPKQPTQVDTPKLSSDMSNVNELISLAEANDFLNFNMGSVTVEVEKEYYDRSEEIYSLLEKGSSNSKYSFVVLNSMGEIASKRAIKIDYFLYKFAFCIGSEDSMKLMGKSRTIDVEANLRDSTVIFSNGNGFDVIRPYAMDESYPEYFNRL